MKDKLYLIVAALLCILSMNSCLVDTLEWDDSDMHGDQYKNITFHNRCNESVYLGYATFGSSESEFTTKMMMSEGMVLIPKDGTYRNMCAAIDNKELVYQIMIIKSSTYDKYGKDDIVNKNIFDKKYTLSYDQLESKGFVIEYVNE